MSAFKDITGEKFGRLVVVGPHKRRGGMTYWNCSCSCGSPPKYIALSSLRSGATKSCECLHRESAAQNARARSTTHGKFGSKIYHCWGSMVARCNNPKNTQYRYYGARGIKVDPRWLIFENFYLDMGDSSPKMTLERSDNDGDYCKENCRWVTMREQCNNRRNSRFIEHNGEIKTAANWGREPWVVERGLSSDLLSHRHRKGERGDVLFAPPHCRIHYKNKVV